MRMRCAFLLQNDHAIRLCVYTQNSKIKLDRKVCRELMKGVHRHGSFRQ